MQQIDPTQMQALMAGGGASAPPAAGQGGAPGGQSGLLALLMQLLMGGDPNAASPGGDPAGGPYGPDPQGGLPQGAHGAPPTDPRVGYVEGANARYGGGQQPQQGSGGPDLAGLMALLGGGGAH